jgi:hypothetical protein
LLRGEGSPFGAYFIMDVEILPTGSPFGACVIIMQQ